VNPVWNALVRFTRRNRAVPRYVAMRNAREARECPNCNPTAKAIKRVQAQWVVAGIDKGE